KYINHIVNAYWDNSVAQNISRLLFSGRLFICLCVSTHKTAHKAPPFVPHRIGSGCFRPAIRFFRPGCWGFNRKEENINFDDGIKKLFCLSTKRNG
ncbi:TPA: hypothetical protein ACMWSC_002133, partial [Neisseria gonorrhoeae]